MRLTLLLALSLCGSVGRAQSVRAVDFADRVWEDTCVGSVQTHRGRHYAPADAPFGWFHVYGVAFGDLDGDGVDEAVVATGCGGLGVVGPPRDTRVFSLHLERLRELARLEEGDLHDGLLINLRVERGVVVERRLANDLDGAFSRYVITRRRRLRDGRLVEHAAASVECSPRHPRCRPPTALPTSVYFGVARTSVTRVFTFDGDGRLPTLDVLLDAGQPLEVFAWCSGTALTALRVAARDATTVGADGDGRVAVSASHPPGRYVVSLRAQRPVGLCYARLWVPTVDTERTED